MAQKILLWTPRILCILAIIFMMVFSIDCFGEYATIKEQLICFTMHNIPAFIFILVLYFAWKQKLIGGILLIIVFIVSGLRFNSFTGNWDSLLIISPFLISGLLFIIGHYLERKAKPNSLP